MTTRRTCRGLTILGTTAVVAFTSVAFAQPNDPALAETLFQEGTALFDAGNFTEACPKFAASHKADPSYGAVFNLATCDEKIGKTASAWAAFLEASALAKNAAEAADAKQRADAIAAKLVRLQINVSKPADGLTLRRDGVALDRAAWGTPVPVDPGSYRLDADAPGKEPWSMTMRVEGEGKILAVEVPSLADAPATTPTSTATIAAPTEPLTTHHKLALAAGGVGLAGVAIGSALALVAKSKWDEAKPHCDDQRTCDPFGLTTGNSAHALADGATAAFVVGGAGLAAGLILLLTVPRPNTSPLKSATPSAEAQPWLSGDGAGVRLRGRF